jgi:hypothetical protein
VRVTEVLAVYGHDIFAVSCGSLQRKRRHRGSGEPGMAGKYVCTPCRQEILSGGGGVIGEWANIAGQTARLSRTSGIGGGGNLNARFAPRLRGWRVLGGL